MVGLTHVLALAAGSHATLAPADATTLWYVTRTLGVAAYVSMAFSVMLGILRTVARRAREGINWRVDELHQFVATLSVLMVVGHLLALRFDAYMTFTWANLLLPLDEPYRPLAVQVGVFAFYAVAATVLTSWLKRRLKYGTWRAVHYLSFAAFLLVTLHGWLAGSDSDEPWMRAIYGGAVAAVAFLAVVRVLTGRRSTSKQPRTESQDAPYLPSAYGRRS
jgi:predicted ferric reductase